jgi:hypothetical protein
MRLSIDFFLLSLRYAFFWNLLIATRLCIMLVWRSSKLSLCLLLHLYDWRIIFLSFRAVRALAIAITIAWARARVRDWLLSGVSPLWVRPFSLCCYSCSCHRITERTCCFLSNWMVSCFVSPVNSYCLVLHQ